MRKKLTQTEVAKIVHLRNKGLSVREIALELNHSRSTVSKYVAVELAMRLYGGTSERSANQAS